VVRLDGSQDIGVWRSAVLGDDSPLGA